MHTARKLINGLTCVGVCVCYTVPSALECAVASAGSRVH